MGGYLMGLLADYQQSPTVDAVAFCRVQPVPWHPCAQIRMACSQAGFVPNGAEMGVGIAVDCIRPIVVGMPQREQATKPLPPFDPQVVVACKVRSPNFGMDRGQSLFALRTP
jgi:hypothetical protein